MQTEVFDIVDADDHVIGRAERSEVHGNPDLLHRVAHVLVFNSAGLLYLQRRSEFKDVQPGKWDTSVGGHVAAGETYEEAARREMQEELGIKDAALEFLHKYIHSNDYESEYVCTFRAVWDGPISFDPDEIADGRYWGREEIRSSAASGIFTPNFLDELDRIEPSI